MPLPITSRTRMFLSSRTIQNPCLLLTFTPYFFFFFLLLEWTPWVSTIPLFPPEFQHSTPTSLAIFYPHPLSFGHPSTTSIPTLVSSLSSLLMFSNQFIIQLLRYLRHRRWTEVMLSPLPVRLPANRISQSIENGFGRNLVESLGV